MMRPIGISLATAVVLGPDELQKYEKSQIPTHRLKNPMNVSFQRLDVTD